MPLWSLEPDPDGVLAAKWASSCHKGTAIVRAPDEKMARICASLTFSGFPGGCDISSVVQNTMHLQALAWVDLSLVRCVPTEDSRYPEDGPTLVLDPSYD